jgi:hypothetical protein
MADMKVGTLRLRSVRFKNGGELRLLPTQTREDDVRFVRERVERVIDTHTGRIAGVALVVWAPDNSSTVTLSVNDSSKIPSIMVPDFVRNRLLAERIESWTLDDIAAGVE